MSVPAADNLLARRHETCALGVKHDPCRSCLAINAAADLLEAIDALHQPLTYLSGNLKCCHDRKPWPCPTACLLHPEVKP